MEGNFPYVIVIKQPNNKQQTPNTKLFQNTPCSVTKWKNKFSVS